MNDYTFMFHLARGLHRRDPGTAYWNIQIQYVFYLRWRSKWSMDSQRRRARDIVLDFVRDKIRNDPEYAAQLVPEAVESLNGIYSWRYIQRYSGHMHGHPQFVRVEQPDGFR